MSNDILVLLGLSMSLAFTHTLFGPDHYLPFIMMAKARRWSRSRSLWITLVCGVGHVASSVVLGFLGIAAGIAVSRLEAFESVRGNLAAWGIIAFGLIYCAWGLRQAWRNRPHQHVHRHAGGCPHVHEHVHQRGHAHLHGDPAQASITPWAMFVLFVLGPCEPLIPLLMYPAAQGSLWGTVGVTVLFGTVTILTMMAAVLVGTLGVDMLPLRPLHRYMHSIAGATLCLSGIAIIFLGL